MCDSSPSPRSRSGNTKSRRPVPWVSQFAGTGIPRDLVPPERALELAAVPEGGRHVDPLVGVGEPRVVEPGGGDLRPHQQLALWLTCIMQARRI